MTPNFSFPSSRRLTLPLAVAIWAVVVLVAGFTGAWLGYGGRAVIVALAVAAALFAFEFFLAVPRILEAAQAWLGGRLGLLAPLVPLLGVVIYCLAVRVSAEWMAIGVACAIVPALLLAGSAGRSPGHWEDYVALVLIWLPVEFRWLYHLFPNPPGLTHTLTILLALSTAVAAFLLVRKLEGVGYGIEWRRGFTWHILLHLAIFAAIAIPLGLRLHFIAWAPSAGRMRMLPLSIIGILFFTAWPEEFLFRGLLQNLLSRTFKSDWAALIVASVLFGLSHILHAPFPNWKYVLLATIAGLFYGHVWMRTRSLLPAVLVHALVDILWHVLFS
ncbi:MAG TPA: type II CAAX endopeptidase family protein [Candidatus Acidoferrales bacterium]|nr:type II CAAX endopeptidase family protein [Candidatus Acidoferrales bacterium]